MKHAHIVIGSCLGDEGKGKLVDYYSQEDKADLVVRFNGGAQAAHTVHKKNGKRFVFGHLGSGSFNDVPTYLSQHFIVNPMIFSKELSAFLKIHSNLPSIFIDSNCQITTHYDMAINALAEASRGEDRHGSCGIGINETVHRSQNGFSFQAEDLMENDTIYDKCKNIRDNWVSKRLTELGIHSINDHWNSILFDDSSIDAFLGKVEILKQYTVKVKLDLLHSKHCKNVVFEGAQGLLLDEEHEWFPHVTRSKTGLHNALHLISQLGGASTVKSTYVMRPYMTRHGAGPLPYENCEYNNIEDETNIPNLYQGQLRVGLLDINLLSKTIRNDIIINTDKFKTNVYSDLAINCLDHCMQFTDGKVHYILDEEKVVSSEEKFIKALTSKIGIRKIKLNYSPITPEAMMEVEY